MTRRFSKRVLWATLAVLVLMMGTAVSNAAGTDKLLQALGVSYPYYGYNSGINFDVTEEDKGATIKDYQIDIPAGWHIALNTIDASPQTSCAGLTSANISSSAEQVGSTTVHVANDATRASTGPAFFNGAVYFLKYHPLTETATFCARATIGNGPVQAANRELMYEIKIKHNVGGSFTMMWNYSAVTGATAGSRSIFDSPYWQTQDYSILFSRITFQSLTVGNFNKTPAGTKQNVRFVWNPDATGSYVFTGTYTPCTTGDPGVCMAPPTPAVRTTTVNITNYPVGYHPGAALTQPAFWSVFTGTAPIAFKWNQPVIGATSPDQVKGYIIGVVADYVPNSVKTIRLITDPTDGAFNPATCGAAGTDAGCVHNLSLPYTSDASTTSPTDGNFSAGLITIFKDGHRSDGRCDDGTGAGYAPPCAPDNSVPGTTGGAYVKSGVSYTQFMHRAQSWPLVYREIGAKGNASRGYGNVPHQIYILLADLDARTFEFVEWKPTGNSYRGGGQTLNGSNSTGGVISFTNTVSGVRYYLDAALTSSSASGLWLRTSTQNDIQNLYRFSMSRIN